jgi:hypothetical protein
MRKLTLTVSRQWTVAVLTSALAGIVAGCKDKSAPSPAPTSTSNASTATVSAAPSLPTVQVPPGGMVIRVTGRELKPPALPPGPLTVQVGDRHETVKSMLAFTVDESPLTYLVLSWAEASCSDLAQGRPVKAGALRALDHELVYVKLFREAAGWRATGAYAPTMLQDTDGDRVQVLSGDGGKGHTLEARVDLALETGSSGPGDVLVKGDVKATGCGALESELPPPTRDLKGKLRVNGVDLAIHNAHLVHHEGDLALFVTSGRATCERPFASGDAIVHLTLSADAKSVKAVRLAGGVTHNVQHAEYDEGESAFAVKIDGEPKGEGVVDVEVTGKDQVGDVELDVTGKVAVLRCSEN